MNWLPMTTAPKDGTDILVYKEFATVPIVHLAWYRRKEDNPLDFTEEDEGWWTYPEHSVTQIKLEGPGHEPLGWFPCPTMENKK